MQVDFDASVGRWVLSHTVTRESVLMPPGAWQASFDAQGFGSMNSSDGEVQLMDEIFELEVCEDDTGRALVDFHCEQSGFHVLLPGHEGQAIRVPHGFHPLGHVQEHGAGGDVHP